MEQKTVYVCDGKDGVFGSTKFVDEGYQLAANESFEMPPVGLYKPKLVNGQWQGLTEEQMKAEHPEWFPSTKPTEQQKLDAQTQIQLAQLLQQNKKQAAFNAQLTVDVATLKKQLAETAKAAQ